jgi:hypothetical protein
MKTKPILLVIVTLVIGFVLGMLTSAQLRFNRLKPVRLYSSEERFREGFFKTIEPDEKQKAEIEKILDKYAKLNSDLQGNFRKELDSNIKELRKELDSRLTKEQLARLKVMDDRRQEMIRQGRRDHRDSSDNRGMGPFNRNGRGFPDNGPMHRDGRQGHPEDRPMIPPPDSSGSPDSK